MKDTCPICLVGEFIKGEKIKDDEKAYTDIGNNVFLLKIQEDKCSNCGVLRKDILLMSSEEIKDIRDTYDFNPDQFALALGIPEEKYIRIEAFGNYDKEINRRLEISKNPNKFSQFVKKENNMYDENNKIFQDITFSIAFTAMILEDINEAFKKVMSDKFHECEKEKKKQEKLLKKENKKSQGKLL